METVRKNLASITTGDEVSLSKRWVLCKESLDILTQNPTTETIPYIIAFCLYSMSFSLFMQSVEDVQNLLNKYIPDCPPCVASVWASCGAKICTQGDITEITGIPPEAQKGVQQLFKIWKADIEDTKYNEEFDYDAFAKAWNFMVNDELMGKFSRNKINSILFPMLTERTIDIFKFPEDFPRHSCYTDPLSEDE